MVVGDWRTSSKRDDVLRVPNAALRWKPDGYVPDTSAKAREGAKGTAAGGRSGRVFRVEGGKPVAVALRVGISDGQRTEVLDGLADGDAVVTGETGAGGPAPKPGGQRRGPF